jgi:nephrocystin-3
MPISIADLASMMDAEGYPYKVRDDGETNVICCSVSTESYRDTNGHSGVGLVIDVLEDDAYVTIVAPRAYYLADCPHKAAALEAFMGMQWRSEMVVCEYDSDDGEVRPSVSVAVEDGNLTQRQFLRLLWSIPQFLDRWHSCIVQAMETGIIDFDSDSNGPVSATEAPLLADSVDYDAPSRTVRIFISSTFRDFTQERDLLVRKVFPELRRRCRERQVELIDVDLRWGITEEEAQQGRVLPICLAEIDRARPFFMGLIGDRYGWVPAAEQFDQSLLIEQPWLDEHRGGKSVTELEILHGVLNNPEMAGRAFFYFRDSAWSQKQGDGYASEGVSEKQKLLHLKDRIRSSGFPVTENYPDPETLAERVREDLWSLIDAAYPESEMPDARTLERQRHNAYGASRRRLYLGGERYFEALDDELANDAPRPVLVTGQSGGGKSALLSNWLARWRPAHPEAAVIVHHLGCGADAADPIRLAVRLMQEISLLTGEKFELKSDPDEQLDDLPQWLAIASVWAERMDRTLLIVLDGLDKFSDRRHLRWFPMALPPRVSLVASCLVGEVLDAASTRLEWQELIVEPFGATEQSRFIAEYLGRYRKQLTPPQAQSLQSHPLSGNPLFLLTVLEELRVFGVHEELDQRLATLLSPPPSKQPGESPTVDDAFEHVLARIEGDLGREPVQRVMEALWASRAGLYTDELLEIANVPPATWAGIANALDESLYETRGRVAFGHDYLRKAVEDRYAIVGEEQLGLHRRLAEYFDGFEPNARVAEELPWQWKQAADREHLKACLTNLEMFTVLYAGDEYELLRYWVWLGEDISAAYETACSKGGDWQIELGTAWRLANFLRTAGCYTEFVLSLYRGVVREEESQLGSGHPGTLGSVNNLAILLADQGDYAAAEPLYRRALEGSENSLGPDHPDTLRSVGNLARLLRSQGDYAAAGPLFRRVLEGYQKSLGPDHPDTLRSVGNLANLIRDQGDYAAAVPLFRRALDGREKSLGPDHPDTLRSVGNLARLLRDQGDYATAEPLCRRALEGFETSLGPDHPDTLASVHGFALLLSDQGDYATAELLYRRALDGREKLLGSDHPDTLASVHGFAGLLVDHGDYAAAEPLCRRALEGNEKSLGPDHPHTLASVSNLAHLLRTQGDYAAAEPLFRRALEGNEKSLGPDHPDTLASVNNVAIMLDDQGDYAAAEPLFRRALEGRQKSLGPEHPDTLASVNNLANLLGDQGDYAAAEPLFRRALEGREKSLGPDHPDTLTSVNNLAALLGDQGDHAAAGPLFRRALKGREETLGPDHLDTLASVNNLAIFMGYHGDYAAAEPLYRRALEGRENSLGPDHPDTLATAHNLAILLDEAAENAPPPPPAGPFAIPPGTITNSIGMQIVPIPAGEFLMGSPEDCPLGDADEEFQHRVRITKPFLLGMHQVTQRQYERVTGETPSHFKGDDLPVEHLSWKEAQRFCEMLSSLPAERQAGRRYRLPTEAEWEYACRAGTTTPFNTGDSLEPDQARFSFTNRSSPKQTAPVGTYPPNAWGLFDMHGNVWEWTADWFSADYFRESPIDNPQGSSSGTHHTLRGGSASVRADECRTAVRGEAGAGDGPDSDASNRYPLYGDFGIRVACDNAQSMVGRVSTPLDRGAAPVTFDFKREIVDPLSSLRNQLCELTTKDTAASILPAVLMPLAKDGVGHPLITLALVSDLLRVLRDAIYADDSLSTEEEGFVGPVAWGLINQMAKHRKDYAALAAAPQRALRKALELYSSDAKAFGYACSTTKWAGAIICRQASPLCKGWSASDDYLAILRKLATAILSVDTKSDEMLQHRVDSLLADAVALSRTQ